MKNNCKNKNPLQRDGRNQSQRHQKALQPTSVSLDDRSTEDLLQYAYRYAAQLNFYNDENIADGDWTVFFEKINTHTLEEIETNSNNDPHFTLFLCFLKLFKFSQNQLNELTGKHLDFYYKKILQLQEKSETPDRVHLIFELAKNANEQFIQAGTRFLAGKDDTGVPMEYIAEEDTLINNTTLEWYRTIRREGDTIHFSSITNSEDGLGDKPIENGIAWNAFGHSGLPIVAPGFALASPVLALQEGLRKVTILLSIASLEKLELISKKIPTAFEIFASGKEDWLGAFALDNSSSIQKIGSSRNNYLLRIVFEIPNDEEAIMPFDANILTGNFNTTSPMLRIVLNDKEVYGFLEKSNLTKIQIETEVNGIQTLALENDFGKLNPTKPFAPFGAAPRKRANFYIGHQEAFTKTLKSFQLNLRWQNLPVDFAEHYKEYDSLKSVVNQSFNAQIQILNKKNWKESSSFHLFNKSLGDVKTTVPIDFPENKNQKTSDIILDNSRTQQLKNANPRYQQSYLPMIEKGGTLQFFEKATAKQTKKKQAASSKKPTAQLDTSQKEGFVRLVLSRDFGHQEYPSIYAIAIAKKVKTATTKLPQEPYTPTLESMTLDYHATTDEVGMTASFAQQYFYKNREIQFFHLHPFGHSEEHPYLKSELPFPQNNTITLFPKRENEGEFFMGLKNIEPNQSLSLLLQLDEGSANPELEKQDVEWSILSNNHWKILDDKYLLADHTNQLLTSGIVKLILPKIATNDNTILDDGYFWLRLAVKKQTDAMANFIGIHPQALQVIFENNDVRQVGSGNDPLHLETALPSETISKMKQRLPSIKKVIQPYDSFGGKTKEQSTPFYTRISERLRHKNRAVSIWDYEHLVLENFPEIYKVKCLNHTSSSDEFAAGNVYLVVIPNLKNRNTANFLKPKVSSNTLLEIQNFLQKKASMFTNIVIQNADFEEVILEFDVAFHAALEFGFYKKQLNEDLKKFLTPWAFEEGRDIHFGGKMHKSILINFIDSLEYVDFISNFYMYHRDEKGIKSTKLDSIETTTSRAILVSAENHTILQTNVNAICQ